MSDLFRIDAGWADTSFILLLAQTAEIKIKRGGTGLVGVPVSKSEGVDARILAPAKAKYWLLLRHRLSFGGLWLALLCVLRLLDRRHKWGWCLLVFHVGWHTEAKSEWLALRRGGSGRLTSTLYRRGPKREFGGLSLGLIRREFEFEVLRGLTRSGGGIVSLHGAACYVLVLDRHRRILALPRYHGRLGRGRRLAGGWFARLQSHHTHLCVFRYPDVI